MATNLIFGGDVELFTLLERLPPQGEPFQVKLILPERKLLAIREGERYFLWERQWSPSGKWTRGAELDPNRIDFWSPLGL